MNNRYLYKAKRKDNGEWVCGNLIFRRIWSSEFYVIRVEDNGFDNYEEFEVIPETICQCTTLIDKNGKLIFTDDILHIRTGKGWSCPAGIDIYYKVVFTEFNKEHYGCTEYIGFMAERSNGSLSSIYYTVTSYGAEVIGNIHDDDLLELMR